MNYRHFEIETFEAGKGLWHARLRREDQLPIVIDGIELEVLNVGIAWPSIGTAIEDAERYIDRMSGSLHATP